ncbi:MAG: hypothetical protein NTV32_10860, partial [Gammaproteobacteria bacterium]|nr:hypothetical protein [Gammaproteobacteria bacterium]
YVPPFLCEDLDKHLETLQAEYKEVIPVSHSSGFMSVVNLLQNNDELNIIDKAILLDPVDSQLIKTTKYNFKKINRLLFMTAKKSYDKGDFWFPFIPSYFKLEKDMLKLGRNCFVDEIEYNETGHCDILDPYYAKFMFNAKLSNGVANNTAIYEYHQWVANQLAAFICPPVTAATAIADTM